ncbi:hypothetical protein WA158_000361 [Blastocystis sp. Blastoise]
MTFQIDIEKKLITHSERVKCVDLHPTEPWILMSLFSGRVFIYNYETAELIKSFECVEVPIRTCKFIERKQWFALGCDDLHIRVYNYNTIDKVADFEAHTDYIRSLDVHPTLPYLLSCGDDLKIKLWNWEQNWNCTKTFDGHSHYVMQVKFNPKDPNVFASCSLDSTINVWGLNNPTPFFTLRDHKMSVNAIAYYPRADKPYLISGSDDHTIKVWDYQTKTCIQTLSGHTDNISTLLFHNKLPLIISGSEDGTVRIWNSITYQCEMTLNYSMGRVWSISGTTFNNKIGIACDDGALVIQMGSEKPIISLEEGGRLIKCDCRSELFPRFIAHNANGRFLMIVGDGEYSICTSRQIRNKCYGEGLEGVWRDSGAGDYAIRTSTNTIKIFSNFKETVTITAPFIVDHLFGGHLLGIRGNGFICFYNWETGSMERKIDVIATNVYWNKYGSYVSIITQDTYYILEYNPSLSADDAFAVITEVTDIVTGGTWVEDVFLYSTPKCVKYYIGGELIVVTHIQSNYTLLGFLEKENKLLLVDGETNIISHSLSTSLLQYQVLIIRGDIESANQLLPSIPAGDINKLSQFLEGQGYKAEAMELSTDIFKKIDIAIELEMIEKATEFLNILDSRENNDSVEISKYWNRLSELCLKKGDIEHAKIYSTKGHDYPFLLLLALSTGDKQGIEQLVQLCKEKHIENLAFISLFSMGDIDGCIHYLESIGKYAECCLLARSYKPELLEECTKKWHEQYYKSHPSVLRETKA